MSKIIGVTVGTPLGVDKIKEKIKPVTSDELQSAVKTALQGAKNSGDFDGADGQRGTGILKITSAPMPYTTPIETPNGTIVPRQYISISAVLQQSGASEIIVGDTLLSGNTLFTVGYLDDTYAYITAAGVSIRGPAGSDGAKGDTGQAGENGTSAWVEATETAVGYDLLIANTAYIGGEPTKTEQTVSIKHGAKGDKGDKGDTGPTGPAGADGAKGDKGDTGPAGADGVGIKSIAQTTTSTDDGGINVFTVNLDNGGKTTFLVTNGHKGSQGAAGADGQRGTGILNTTTGIASYTTTVNGIKPTYRILLSTLKTQSKVDEVLIGDTIRYSFFLYPVIYVDDTYAYMGTRVEIRGAAGAAGAAGANGVTFTPSVDANGNLSWSNDGDLPNPATVNIKGPAGNDGKDGASESVAVPDYWLEHLADKASAIQTAMEKAGRHKSAFLWYTDAHWPNGNSKVSPVLLKYLYENTPMNKVNFGGDIIGDTLLATRDDMEYLYEWRKAIKGLPNHHSVFGNHDKFDSSSVDYEDDNYRYTFLLAPEESSDMVMGDGNYYYIDNPSEKTRYLYLDYLTGDQTAMMAQGQFVVDSLKSAPEGWHIVAIAHRWWQYNSSSTPLTGKIPTYETEILSVFDAYNARTARSGSNYFYAADFTDGKAKVEFCIGGHIHVDYDFESTGGIPVIITTSDTNQNRVPDSTVDSGTVGTTTEAAVFGIIADYTDADNTKINVIGVGRGTSRVVRKSTVKPTSISDITYSGDTTVGATIDKSKFSFTVNYNTGATDTINGATSVSPATIGVVGDNAVTITYAEGTVTVSGTVTIVGTAVPTVNLFDKNDTDVLDTGRFNSSQAAVAYQAGQLITGYIDGKVGDTFIVTTDKSLKTNGYTGAVMTYNASKTANGQLNNATTVWTFSADGLTGTVTIPSSYSNKDHSSTALVRFCVAYTDMDNIVITKA